ncbi:HNH endonuclease signature motif containing protein [Methylorubrum rhodesianum]|uniref:HNH endonuclease n=1 Tax=Methylorubrum rhodesianum TaxID=29427 RepID=UPI003D2B263A
MSTCPQPRKKLSTLDKLKVVLAQARCPLCGERLGELTSLQFDHHLALALGGADSVENLRAVHTECHRVKTTGRAGTSKLAMVNGDAQKIAKNRQRAKKQAEREAARAALPEPPPGRMKAKPPSRWPKRPLISRNTFADRRSR